MATYTLPTPFGIADDETGGTTVEDMQRIIASQYERWSRSKNTRRGIIAHDGPQVDGKGVELRPDATLRIHEGVVLMELAPNRCIEAVVPYVSAMDPGIAVGAAGEVAVLVAPPVPGENDAQLVTTTGTPPQGSVILERLVFPSGWKTTSEATRNTDQIYATPRGTGGGRLSDAVDADTAVRHASWTYQRLHQSFVVPTDAHVGFELSNTLRACDEGGDPIPFSEGIVAEVVYEIYLDGVLLTSFPRTISGYAESKYFYCGAQVSAGRHTVHVESRSGNTTAPGHWTYWRVMHGGSWKHRGDYLAVRHEGVRA